MSINLQTCNHVPCAPHQKRSSFTVVRSVCVVAPVTARAEGCRWAYPSDGTGFQRSVWSKDKKKEKNSKSTPSDTHTLDRMFAIVLRSWQMKQMRFISSTLRNADCIKFPFKFFPSPPKFRDFRQQSNTHIFLQPSRKVISINYFRRI